jgi:hypothetical protein
VLLSDQVLVKYAENDWILKVLEDPQSADFETFTGSRSLRESKPKRAIYEQLYGPILFGEAKDRRVLDDREDDQTQDEVPHWRLHSSSD